MTKPMTLKADEMFCHAVYTAGHVINRAYGPLLADLGLTYPQYITLMTLWEEDGLSVGALCEKLRLESSTRTPLLKRLETMGHIERNRGSEDERQVFVSLTPSGRELQKSSPEITRCIIEKTGYEMEKLESLVKSVSELRDNLLR